MKHNNRLNTLTPERIAELLLQKINESVQGKVDRRERITKVQVCVMETIDFNFPEVVEQKYGKVKAIMRDKLETEKVDIHKWSNNDNRGVKVTVDFR